MPPSKTEKPEKGDKPAKSAKPAKAKAIKAGARPEATRAPATKAEKPAKAPRSKPAAAAAARPARARKGKAAPDQLELAEAPPAEVSIEVADVELEGFAAAPEADQPGSESSLADDDEDALHERVAAEAAELAEVAAEEPPPLSAEERELAAIYGDEMAAAPAGAAHAEFSDRRTADEDRPMTPEINGRVERQKRWEERREARDARRQRREQERQRRFDRVRPEAGRPDNRPDRPHGLHVERGDRPAPGTEPSNDRPPNDRLAPGNGRPALAEVRDNTASRSPNDDRLAPENGARADGDGAGVARVGNALGDAAWQVFAGIKGAQPMQVKQLAGMMRKRGLLEGDPEMMWPHLKAALLGDERSYRSLGLRPRIVYRGRDLFAPGPVAQSPTATAEANLARALSVMAVATHRTLKDKIASATQSGFERLVHAYLVSAGFRDITWIKRVDAISYATALPPEGQSTVLVSARSGDVPVDRRGIGELRVGVEAKQLLAGFLFAARELSPDAERELERNGRSITVVAGDAFITALLASGVGVVTTAAPLRYVDDQLLGELLAG